MIMGEHVTPFNHIAVLKGFLLCDRPFYNGGTLSTLIHLEQDEMVSSLLLPQIIQIGKGLQNIHKNKLVCGDLKPSNILLDNEKENVFITDVGLFLIRKPSYSDINTLSPERLKCEEITYKSDIWAYCCLIYLYMTGTHLFKGNYVGELYTNIVNTSYTTVEPIPFYLNALIRGMINIYPSKRYNLNVIIKFLESIIINIY